MRLCMGLCVVICVSIGAVLVPCLCYCEEWVKVRDILFFNR